MPSTNQIKGLQPSRRTAGATYHWKPSPRERRHGFANLMLGTDYDGACLAAIARNSEVEAWFAEAVGATAPRAAPRILRWRDLVATYKADPAFLELKPKSRAEYESRIRALTLWALDGELRLSDVDRPMIVNLRNTLVKDPRKHRTAALLRVLRILANYGASQGWLPRGLTDDLNIPEVASRKTIIAAGGSRAPCSPRRSGGPCNSGASNPARILDVPARKRPARPDAVPVAGNGRCVRHCPARPRRP
jgi:hypothetical protein